MLSREETAANLRSIYQHLRRDDIFATYALRAAAGRAQQGLLSGAWAAAAGASRHR